MSASILHIVLWLLAAGGIAVVMRGSHRLTLHILRTRTDELATSQKHLEEYERAFVTLIDDRLTPESTRNLLIEFDRGVMDRGAAFFVAKSIFRHGHDWLKTDGKEPQPLAEIKEVGKHRPDLYEAFIAAISSGFIATMLRWYIPAYALRLLFVDPRRDPITPACAVVSAVDRHSHKHPLPQAA